jgi:hypothetical protein
VDVAWPAGGRRSNMPMCYWSAKLLASLLKSYLGA